MNIGRPSEQFVLPCICTGFIALDRSTRRTAMISAIRMVRQPARLLTIVPRFVTKTTVLALLVLSLIGSGSDNLNLNPAQLVALQHRYNIVGWEAQNLLSKWVHLARRLLPWSGRHAEDSYQVSEYFHLTGEINKARAELDEVTARSVEVKAPLVMLLDQLGDRREKLRNDVEQVLEGAISKALSEADIGSWGPLLFPPVDIRLTEPPHLLVTSRRDRIERTYDVLLEPEMRLEQAQGMERVLQEEWDLSALVVQIGGLATYPASVANLEELQGTLRLMAHEWVHNYLSARFTPLGVNIHSSPEMLSLNETVADIVGRSIGERAYEILDTFDEAGSKTTQEPESAPMVEVQFDFEAEMRETRQRVDGLLADGAVETAETFMEERRKMFLVNGHYIRKLNQAYFAFYGTYAESPASVSPIAAQLHEFSELSYDLGTFLATMAGFSTYDQFLGALEEARKRAGYKGAS